MYEWSDLRLPASVFNYLLSSLCAADILFLCSNLLVFLSQLAPVSLNIRHFSPQVLPYHFDLSTDSLYGHIFFPFFECACHFSYCTSIFIVITLTVERCQVEGGVIWTLLGHF